MGDLRLILDDGPVGDDGLTDNERAQLAARVLARRPSREGLLAYQWMRMTDGQHDDHRATCDGCDMCKSHRIPCHQCGHDVSYDDEWCGSCGEHWPTSKDPYVKASER